MAKFETVFTKAFTRYGRVYPATPSEYEAEVVPKKSIAIRTTKNVIEDGVLTPKQFNVSFKIGDTAVYGSYNLIYTGKIVAIGPKTVTVEEPYGIEPRIHRLSLHEFAWRNYDFDLERISTHNSEEMLYI